MKTENNNISKEVVLNFLTNLSNLLEKSLNIYPMMYSNIIIINNAILKMRKVIIDNVVVDHTPESLSNLMMTEFSIDININGWELDMLKLYASKFNIVK